MTKATLAERLLAAREFWVDMPELGEGRRVKLRRPSESQILQMRAGATLEHVQTSAVAWEGVTEADLLGPEVGASDLLPFDAEAWSVFVADHIAISSRCALRITEVISEHLQKLKETRGN